MLAFPAGFKIYLAVAPVDMRKQFNGLWAEAEHQLKIDPRQGAVSGHLKPATTGHFKTGHF